MKGHQIIELITKNGLEDFEIQLSIMTKGNPFPNIQGFEITGLADIGHSDKVVLLEGNEIQK